jgi:hypothetical protein
MIRDAGGVETGRGGADDVDDRWYGLVFAAAAAAMDRVAPVKGGAVGEMLWGTGKSR